MYVDVKSSSIYNAYPGPDVRTGRGDPGELRITGRNRSGDVRVTLTAWARAGEPRAWW